MNPDQRYSDEFLNAFVDNQLDPEEKGRAYADLSRDESLNRQVCELRKLHDLVQLAYRDVPAPPTRAAAPAKHRNRLGFGAAAAVVLSIGIALGIQIKPPTAVLDRTTSSEPTAIATAPAKQPAKTSATSTVSIERAAPVAAVPTTAIPTNAATAPTATAPRAKAAPLPASPVKTNVDSPSLWAATPPRSINEVHIGNVRNKVLIHIAHDNPSQLTQALEEIEGLMHFYRDTRQSAHVEVVVNGRGLELVRADVSAHAATIARLLKEYDNLTFAACQNTIDRLKREQGITARLLPGVVVTDSGMAEITRRQHQGWTYLQV